MGKKNVVVAPESKPQLPAPSGDERRASDAAKTRVRARAPRVRVKVERQKDGSFKEVGPHHADFEAWLHRLEDAFASRGTAFPTSQINHLMNCILDGERRVDEGKLNALLAMVQGANASNELEAALAVQIAMAHELTMQAMRRASRVDQIPQYDSAGNMAVRLMRAMAGHIELLAKLQRGGEQTVRVEHVHVHAGGQAVVGTVTTGGGVRNEFGNQPHAPVALPPGTVGHLTAEQGAALLSQDAERESVPVPGGKR